MDGPFGEYPDTYSTVKEATMIKVTAITLRKKPIFQICLTGMPMTENHYMMELSLTSMGHEYVYKITPDVIDVLLSPLGTSRHHAVVSIKNTTP